jgi:hypothetical protein
MAEYDGGFTLLDKTHTVTELEDKLKLVVWDWEVDGDVDTSKANLDTYRKAWAIYEALRRDYGGLGKSTPENPVYSKDNLEELATLWNKYAPAKYKEEVRLPSL